MQLEDSYKDDNILTISVKNVKKNLLKHFIFLKDENKRIKFYNEFKINDENKTIIDMWENIINYLYEEIFHCMSLSISDLKKAVTINNKIPEDFNKIINYLIYNKKYITIEDIKDENFYVQNFPYLYPKKGYFSSIVNYFLPNLNYCKSGNGNDNNQIEEEETLTRNDLSKDYSSQDFPENSILFNYKIFKNHCNAILITLKDILNEEGEEIIMKSTFIEIVSKKYLLTNSDNGNFKLFYGIQNIDEALFYLYKTKQIIIFKISEDKNLEFFKVVENKIDKETEDDVKLAQKLYEDFKKEFEIADGNK